MAAVGTTRSRDRIKRRADGRVTLRMKMHPKAQPVEALGEAVQALLRDEYLAAAVLRSIRVGLDQRDGVRSVRSVEKDLHAVGLHPPA